MNLNKRLQKIIAECGLSQYRIAKDIGVSQSTIKNYRNGVTKPSTSILKQLSEYLSVNYDWLSNGIGEVYLNTEQLQKKDVLNLKYIESDISALSYKNLDIKIKKNQNYINVPGFHDCHIAMHMWGNEMEPFIKNGDIIICKKWNEDYLQIGSAYLIVTRNNQFIVKYLLKGSCANKIKCKSENIYQESFEIKRDDIQKLFIIKGLIRKINM